MSMDGMNDGMTMTRNSSPEGPSHSYRGGCGKPFFKMLNHMAILQVQRMMNEDEGNDTHMTWMHECNDDGSV